jgi:hypothetical protein
MTTTLLSHDAVEELLGEDIRLFRDCLDVAAASAHKQLAGEAAFGSRTKASAIIDLAQAHALAVFGSRAGYRTRRVRDLLVVEAHDQVAVRFGKFADRTGFRFSRNDTRQTKDWEAQRPLDGFPQVTNLYAGYRLDEFEREIQEADLVCMKDDRHMWHLPLPARGEVIDLPRTLDQDAEAVTATRTALRSTLKEDAAAGDSSE